MESDVDEQAFREREVNKWSEEFHVYNDGRSRRYLVSEVAYDWSEDDTELQDIFRGVTLSKAGKVAWADMGDWVDEDPGFGELGRLESGLPPPPTLNSVGQVGEAVQPTEEITSGPETSPAERLERIVKASSGLADTSEWSGCLPSERPQDAPSTPRYHPGSSTDSLSSPSGVGLGKIKEPLSGVSEPTVKEELKLDLPGRVLPHASPASSHATTPITLFRFGKLPAEWRRLLERKGYSVGRNRIYITELECATLVAALPADLHGAVRARAIFVQNMQPKKQ